LAASLFSRFYRRLAVRLSRWTGFATWAEKPLLILHVGYAWLVLGIAPLGLS
jgi:uncharacterized protein involved in response to NO